MRCSAATMKNVTRIPERSLGSKVPSYSIRNSGPAMVLHQTSYICMVGASCWITDGEKSNVGVAECVSTERQRDINTDHTRARLHSGNELYVDSLVTAFQNGNEHKCSISLSRRTAYNNSRTRHNHTRAHRAPRVHHHHGIVYGGLFSRCDFVLGVVAGGSSESLGEHLMI